MASGDPLRDRMLSLLEKTKDAEGLTAPTWWDGDTAGQRRVHDDMRAGRLHWAAANRHARFSLDALEMDDPDLAQACAWTAADCYIAALEVMAGKLRPWERRALTRSAKPRGRPRKKVAP